MSLKGKYTNCGLIICGDFNQAKITNLQDRQLLSVVKFPTRDKNTLDLIITNISGLYETPQRLPPIGKSDHVSILWSPRARWAMTPPVTTAVERRAMPDSSIRRFGQWITTYDWQPVLDATDTQSKTDTFYDIIQQQLDNHFL